ncbi:50S ribosomal protein L20 [Candidatus Woesebacteria bacterium]|nr:50S ribosomal protein L20 [Candidatus Woesebacteria bacterium]QQG47249.1 MAG: 50S ribosomal protein L20 [Candidatus Woesebacteria bacterium]
MARIKSRAAIKHKKLKKETKGFRQARRTRIKAGKEAVLHAGQYAYIGRKLRKRDFRALWIMRLNAAVREHGLSYSKFIGSLKKNKIEIDRKILSAIAISDPKTFKEIISKLK